MLKAIFGSKALLGAASAGVLAVGGGAVALSGNTAEPVQPAQIEQASMQLAEVDTERSYSYEEALALSGGRVVLFSADDVDGADDVAEDVASETGVTSFAVLGAEEGKVHLLFLGDDLGTYDQRGVDRGRLGADAIKHVRAANPARLSALVPEPQQ